MAGGTEKIRSARETRSVTYYPRSVRNKFRPLNDGLSILKPARNVAKLGALSFAFTTNSPNFPKRPASNTSIIRKGVWKGMGFYYLTLREIEDCPQCDIKDICYGKNMPWAVRHDPKAKGFRPMLRQDLRVLEKRHRKGVVVRLHELGDFYDVNYVKWWGKRLVEFPSLHLFGYCHQQGEIGAELDSQFCDRFRIMDSTATSHVRPPASVGEKPGYITCPQQTKRTPSCSTCGLCMNGKNKIAFIPH